MIEEPFNKSKETFENEKTKERHQRCVNYWALGIVSFIVLVAAVLLVFPSRSPEATKWAPLTLTTALGVAGGYALSSKKK